MVSISLSIIKTNINSDNTTEDGGHIFFLSAWGMSYLISIKILQFLVDNIFVVLREKVFQQIGGIPMDTNSAPLLPGIFLYSYNAKFIQALLSAGTKG